MFLLKFYCSLLLVFLLLCDVYITYLLIIHVEFIDICFINFVILIRITLSVDINFILFAVEANKVRKGEKNFFRRKALKQYDDEEVLPPTHQDWYEKLMAWNINW